MQVVCKDSNNAALGVSGDSPNFSIASRALVLMNPGRGTRVANGGLLRVAWKKSSAVTGAVNIFVSSGSGAPIQVATALAGTTFWDVVLPPAVSNSSQVMVRIQEVGNAANQDSVDGYFSVRGTSPVFTTALGGLALQVGSIRPLAWVGPSGSYLVDLDLVGATTVAIVRNLPDFGTYTWFIPDTASTSASIRVTFRNEDGVAINSVNSGTFSVARGAG